MAPSGRSSKSAAAIAEIPDTNTQLELILAKLTALETLPAKVAALEKLLSDSNAQNLALQKQIAEKDKAIAELTAKTNSLEQYNHSWSVRLNNIQLPDGDRTYTVMQTVFDKALRPIFEGAKKCGLIPTIPDCDDVLETAHILPAKASDRPEPIIARFYSRNMRAMVFRLKKEFAPTTTITTKTGKKTTVHLYPIYEDLTKPAHQLLQDLLKDPRTGPVWTIGSHIRYRLKNDDTVRKVVSVFDSVDDILGS
jgi:hypothetical protein